MSTRKRGREPPMRYMVSETYSKMGRGEFTDQENALLLAALLKYGPVDISKLAECIPSRNHYQVKQRILALQKKAQLTLTSISRQTKSGSVIVEPRDKVAIDKWLDQLIRLHDKAQIEHGSQEDLPVRMIPQCMAYIAKFEKHPKPEVCGGVDLKNVYEFMESMMLGLPSKNLRKADARFLIEGLQRLSAALDKFDLGREKSFIFCGRPQWRSKGQRPRTYGVNKQFQAQGNGKIWNFLDLDKYNPFQVPKEWLKKNFE